MARFNKRFEVKNEMSDGGKIRPDDDKQFQKNGGQSSLEQQRIILEEAQQAGGFDDEEIESQQEDIEVEIDENGNPIIPEGWTFLTHNSSLDKWDTSLLGNDFVVGNSTVNGQVIGGRPLCCVERSVARFDYERSGSNTAKAYGGEQQAFEIRVLFYKNPRLGDGKVVRDKLNADEIKDVSHYYMYQGGRHPAVPVGTKLIFVKSGDFDEITNTNGNSILWYIPEQYLQQYLDDVQQTKEIETPVEKENDIEQGNNENANTTITNASVEQELSEFYTDDITNEYLEAYLSEKISQIYGDRLGDAGIFNVRKFLDGKLNDFQGVESYRAIIEELESTLEVAETIRQEEIQEGEQGEIEVAEPVQKEIKDATVSQDEFENELDTGISEIDNPESKMHIGVDSEVPKTEQYENPSFDQALLSVGFKPNTIAGLKSSIQKVSPRALITMDNILGRTKEQTLSRGGNEDGNEQDYR